MINNTNIENKPFVSLIGSKKYALIIDINNKTLINIIGYFLYFISFN